MLEAKYRSVIADANPEIRPYEIELASIQKPTVPPGVDVTKLRGPQLEVFAEMQAKYEAEVEVIKAKHPIGSELSLSAMNVSYLLSRIRSLKGAPFEIDPESKPVPTFRNEEVLKAFDFWLDSEPGIANDTWWTSVLTEIRSVDKPLTGPDEAPPDTLTEDEKRDPLSNEGGQPSSDEQKTILEQLPVNELGT